MSSTAETLERLVRELGTIPLEDPDFTRETDLFDSGYLDSLAIVTLTTRIEAKFSMTLTEQDLFDPNFTTVTGMARLIDARRAAESGL